jgi:hypothetical protein
MEWLQTAIQIAVAAVVSALALLVEHYAPGKTSNVVINYVLGVLALILPLSGLMVVWAMWTVLIAIWVIVAVGGVAVMTAYWIDSYQALLVRAENAEREAEMLRPEIKEHGTHD